MKKDKTLLTLIGTYSTVLLLAAIIGVTVLSNRLTKPPQVITETVVETDYVYVYMGTSPTTEQTDATEEAHVWIVREYEERIGVFSENGELVRVIDVYTKTLPEADRRLLREGIRVTSEKQLYSIIEDYSS